MNNCRKILSYRKLNIQKRSMRKSLKNFIPMLAYMYFIHFPCIFKLVSFRSVQEIFDSFWYMTIECPEFVVKFS